jgi:hypothetical protein
MAGSLHFRQQFYTITIFLIKGLVGLGVLYLGYRQVLLIRQNWYDNGLALSSLSFWWVLISFFMIPINWGVEIIKWRYLLNTIRVASWTMSFKAVLTGVALSLVTPLKLGEYLGRGAHYPSGKRVDALGLNLISTFSHIWVVLFVGLVVLSFKGLDQLEVPFGHHFSVPKWFFAGLAILLLGVLVTPLVLTITWSRIPFWIRAKLPSALLTSNWQGLYKTSWRVSLSLSFARYSIYLHQFLFLLWGLQVDLPWEVLSITLAMMYFIQSGVPLPSFLSFVVRGEVLLWLLTPWEVEPAGVLLASYFQWLFNLGIPAVIGLWGVVGYKSRNKEKHS